MGLYLVSDFRDYYDHQFLMDDIGNRMNNRRFPFIRMSQLDISRVSHLKRCSHYFKAIIPEPFAKQPQDKRYVVYTDPSAHAGKGKVLTDVGVDMQKYAMYSSYYCIPFLEDAASESFRELWIGTKVRARIYYHSADSWMSNTNPDRIILQDLEIMDEPRTFFTDCPLLALDALYKYPSDGGTVIDVNTAPGMKYTGLEDQFSPVQVYDEIFEMVV